MDTHTSYSRVSAYLRCGLAYKFKYVDGLEQEFLPEPLVFGSAFHKSAELYFRAVMVGDRLPDLDQLNDTFTKAWHEIVNASPAEIRYSKEGNDVRSNQLARKMLTAFLDHVSDREFDILAVEHRCSATLAPGLPPLLGFLDLVERLPNGEACITDIKTAAKKYTQAAPADSLQLAAYAAIAKALGHRSEGVQVKFIIVTKAKEPAAQELVAVLDDHDIQRFTRIAQAVHEAVEKGAFVPNPGWQCGSCQWQGACREEMSRAA